jgi:hypothetical protein
LDSAGIRFAGAEATPQGAAMRRADLHPLAPPGWSTVADFLFRECRIAGAAR